jgi:membrane associated rhomboid family serine protease
MDGSTTKVRGAVRDTAAPKKLGMPWATTALLVVLGLVYLAELASGKTLIVIGGLNRTLVLENGEWFRVVLATFLHANFLHFFLNGLVLFLCGMLLEFKVGRAWFLAIYATSGLAGSFMSMALNSADVISVGASGAIMGLLGALFVLASREPTWTQRFTVRLKLLRFLIPALLPSAKVVGGAQVDVACHLGGAIGGAILAITILFLWPKDAERPGWQRVAKAIPIMTLSLLLTGLPSGIATAFLARGILAEAQGEPAKAEAAYDDALRFEPKSTEALEARAIIRFSLVRYSDAADDFHALAELKPGWAYALLFLHIARHHGREDDQDELATLDKGIDLAAWPGPALALFLGVSTPDAVRRAAAQAEAAKDEHQTCEAAFYIGEWARMRGDVGQAATLIKQAADTCPAGFDEHKLATAELARAGAPKNP